MHRMCRLTKCSSYAYQVEVPGRWRPEGNEQMSNMWKEVAWMGTMSVYELLQRCWRLLTLSLLQRVNDLLSLRRELVSWPVSARSMGAADSN